jgi:PAS domain S-box-containing protein
MAAWNEIDLRRALENHEVVPWFQPIVELRTGRLSGFEVLARWYHPERGMAPPADFIPLAEQSGLITQLTDTLLVQAFAVAASFPDHLMLSVNISPIQLRNRSLPLQIQQALERGAFSSRRLILEITESALVLNLDLASSIAQELKTLGAQLALDDFGTGYSSLRHLEALPFDKIKIDSSFVRTMTYRRGSRKIAAAVAGLGHSLGMETVAEGIEEQAQADMLQYLGCELGQGWLYGKPVPAAELPAVLAAQVLARGPEASTPAIAADVALHLEAQPAQRLAQLQAIYDGAPVGLSFLDKNLRTVSLNRRLAEMIGIPVHALLGRTIAEVLPDAFPQIVPHLRRALQGESVAGVEFQLASPAAAPGTLGHSNTLLASFQPVRDEVNETTGISMAVVDITERKRTERALAESEDHYHHAVELNPEVPWTADPEGMILDAGPRWETLTGLSWEETLGNGWVKALHPDDVERTLTLWRQALGTGNPIEVEYRIGRGDGLWRWVRARAAARRGPNGRILRWYGMVEDIDNRKRAEEALRKSEARLQAVFQAVPVGILIAEAPGGQIVLGNPQAETILGRSIYPRLNLTDQREGVMFYPDGRAVQSSDLPMERALQFGRTTDAEEFLYRRGDGSMVWICVTAAPIRGEDGTITGGVAAITDVADGMREREKLRQTVEELRARLALSPS